jgi:hypothetical protein
MIIFELGESRLIVWRAVLIAGVLSPVSIASFIIVSPEMMIASQGRTQSSGISNTSPGTRSSLEID